MLFKEKISNTSRVLWEVTQCFRKKKIASEIISPLILCNRGLKFFFKFFDYNFNLKLWWLLFWLKTDINFLTRSRRMDSIVGSLGRPVGLMLHHESECGQNCLAYVRWLFPILAGDVLAAPSWSQARGHEQVRKWAEVGMARWPGGGKCEVHSASKYTCFHDRMKADLSKCW